MENNHEGWLEEALRIASAQWKLGDGSKKPDEAPAEIPLESPIANDSDYSKENKQITEYANWIIGRYGPQYARGMLHQLMSTIRVNLKLVIGFGGVLEGVPDRSMADYVATNLGKTILEEYPHE